jgi:hypothetical protein
MLNDLLDDGKSDACSRGIRTRVQALKYRENPFCVFHVNADPVVLHRKYSAVFRFLHSNVNCGGIIALSFTQR